MDYLSLLYFLDVQGVTIFLKAFFLIIFFILMIGNLAIKLFIVLFIY
jgi:hypothetical protein